MARYDVYRNASARGALDTPFLLDVQADPLAPRRTRMVVPLRLASGVPRPARTLQPSFRRVGNLGEQGNTILAAVDFLLTGV